MSRLFTSGQSFAYGSNADGAVTESEEPPANATEGEARSSQAFLTEPAGPQPRPVFGGELMGELSVVLVHNRYQQAGGEDRVFEAESALLKSYGHHVERVEVDNSTLTFGGRLGMAAMTAWNHRMYAELQGVFRRTGAQVAHFHNTFPIVSPAAYYAARSAGVAVVQTLHNFRLLCPNALLFRSGAVCEECVGRAVPWPGVVHACYRNSRLATAATAAMLTLHNAMGTWRNLVHTYVALSEFSRQKFIDGGLPADRIVVKPNFLAHDPGVGGHAGRYALFVGRLSTEKGVGLLLRAWSCLRGSLPLKIVGTGPLEGAVRAHGHPVECLGSLPEDRVLALMRDASFLVFPSDVYENCPITLLQAFATALSVVASGHGSIAEMVQDGVTGRQFRPGDATDLCEKVTWAIDHPEPVRAIGAAARQIFESTYTAPGNYSQLVDLYRVAVARAEIDRLATAVP